MIGTNPLLSGYDKIVIDTFIMPREQDLETLPCCGFISGQLPMFSGIIGETRLDSNIFINRTIAEDLQRFAEKMDKTSLRRIMDKETS